jgi:hypothetical protein
VRASPRSTAIPTMIMHDAVKAILEKAKVWSCEDVGEVTLTPDQVEQMMREESPHWFVDEQP